MDLIIPKYKDGSNFRFNHSIFFEKLLKISFNKFSSLDCEEISMEKIDRRRELSHQCLSKDFLNDEKMNERKLLLNITDPLSVDNLIL